jgi:hypothetical protein
MSGLFFFTTGKKKRRKMLAHYHPSWHRFLFFILFFLLLLLSFAHYHLGCFSNCLQRGTVLLVDVKPSFQTIATAYI